MKWWYSYLVGFVQGAGALAAFLLLIPMPPSRLLSPQHFNIVKAVDLTNEEMFQARVVQDVPVMDVVVRFIDPNIFYADNDLDSIASTSYPEGSPCTITFPAGLQIEAWPLRQAARWVRYAEFGGQDIFAHEIMHCVRRSWHAPWTALYNARKDVVERSAASGRK